MAEKLLLSVVELGGYPDFTPLYQRLGYQVVRETRMRKVLKFMKQNQPEVIVAEFNFQSDFRDRTSSLESMLAMVQRMAGVRVIVLYDREYAHQLVKLEAQYQFAAKLAFPLEEAQIEAVLATFN